MAIKEWKRSQISSGFYKKKKGKLPKFIKFERTEYPFNGYHVLYKEGINGESRILMSFHNKRNALSYARKYMRKN